MAPVKKKVFFFETEEIVHQKQMTPIPFEPQIQAPIVLQPFGLKEFTVLIAGKLGHDSSSVLCAISNFGQNTLQSFASYYAKKSVYSISHYTFCAI